MARSTAPTRGRLLSEKAGYAFQSVGRGREGGGPRAIPPIPYSGSQRVNRKSSPRPPTTDLSGQGERSPSFFPVLSTPRVGGFLELAVVMKAEPPHPNFTCRGLGGPSPCTPLRIPSPVCIHEDQDPQHRAPFKYSGFIRTTQPSPFHTGLLITWYTYMSQSRPFLDRAPDPYWRPQGSQRSAMTTRPSAAATRNP